MSLRSCSKNIEPFEGVIIGVRSFEKYKAHLGFNIKYDIKYMGCQNGYYKVLHGPTTGGASQMIRLVLQAALQDKYAKVSCRINATKPEE